MNIPEYFNRYENNSAIFKPGALLPRGYGMDDPGFRIPVKARNFSPVQKAQTCSEIHSDSYSRIKRALLRSKAAGE